MRPLLAILPVVVACATAPDGSSDEPADDTEPPPWFEPDGPGPYAPGVTTLWLDDPRGRTIPVEVWYPARPAADDEPDPYGEIPITIGAYRDAPPARDDAPFPLVAFSHGFGGIRFQSPSLCERLATHGFVVVAPDHDGTILVYLDWEEMDRHILERPDDVRNAVDLVLDESGAAEGRLAGLVASDRYAIVGHSFGAVTGVVLAGAEPDFAAASSFCDANPDQNGCDYLPDIDPAYAAGFDTVDPRIEAMVAMSPGGYYAMGENGRNLANVVPSLVLSGDADGVLPYDTEQRPLWDRLAPPTGIVTLADAGHYAAFSDMCRLLSFFEDCKGAEEGFMEADVGQAITHTLVTAWLRSRWLGDSRDEPWLEPARVEALGPARIESR